MNRANETLQVIRQQKSIITKKYNEAMEILNKEERELMKQFKDIPRQEEEKKE